MHSKSKNSELFTQRRQTLTGYKMSHRIWSINHPNSHLQIPIYTRLFSFTSRVRHYERICVYEVLNDLDVMRGGTVALQEGRRVVHDQKSRKQILFLAVLAVPSYFVA